MAKKSKKTQDAEKRLKQNRGRSADSNDPLRGWDAQQGTRPPQAQNSLYKDDPVVYRASKLPKKDALKAAGYDPERNTLPEDQSTKTGARATTEDSKVTGDASEPDEARDGGDTETAEDGGDEGGEKKRTVKKKTKK